MVGLSADKSVGDHVRSALLLPVVRLLSTIHNETRSVPVVAMPPAESFAEIKWSAGRVLPGVRLRPTLYYRYVLDWTKPVGAQTTR